MDKEELEQKKPAALRSDEPQKQQQRGRQDEEVADALEILQKEQHPEALTMAAKLPSTSSCSENIRADEVDENEPPTIGRPLEDVRSELQRFEADLLSMLQHQPRPSQIESLPGAFACPGPGDPSLLSASHRNGTSREEAVVLGVQDDGANINLARAHQVEENEPEGPMALQIDPDLLRIRRELREKQNRYRLMKACALMSSGVAVILAIVLCTTLSRMNNGGLVSFANSNGTTTEQFDFPDTPRSIEIQKNIREVITDPNMKALLWIIQHDPIQLEANAYNLIQRYALVTFYYSTTRDGPWARCNPPKEVGLDYCRHEDLGNGDKIYRSRWLSGTHECDWMGITCESFGSNGEDVVIRLSFRKSIFVCVTTCFCDGLFSTELTEVFIT